MQKYDYLRLKNDQQIIFLRTLSIKEGLHEGVRNYGTPVNFYKKQVKECHHFTSTSRKILEVLLTHKYPYEMIYYVRVMMEIEKLFRFEEIESDNVAKFAMKLLSGDKICIDMVKDMIGE